MGYVNLLLVVLCGFGVKKLNGIKIFSIFLKKIVDVSAVERQIPCSFYKSNASNSGGFFGVRPGSSVGRARPW